MRTLLLLSVFWVMQATAQAAFGWGSLVPGRWMPGFVIGNAIGVSSILVLMRLYACGNAGLACALGVGGAFVAGQIAMAVVSKTLPTLPQWGCVLPIATGMVGYALSASPSVQTPASSKAQEIKP